MTTDKLREVVRQDNNRALVSPAAKFRHFLQQHKDQIAMAAPKHLNADRLCRLALTAFNQNKQLQECDPVSIFGAVVTAAQLGLEIGVLGQAYLVPYNDKKRGKVAQLIPGWQGLVDLVNRSGRAAVWTGAVFEGDEFEYEMGSRPSIQHKPCGEDDPALLRYTYAVGRVNGSDWPAIDVWDVKRLKRHRDRYNRVGDRHYSFDNWEMYCRKVPCLQVIKYMPKSVELANAIQASYAADAGSGITIDADNMVTIETDDQAPDKEFIAGLDKPSESEHAKT